jgi:hypothetical protein
MYRLHFLARDSERVAHTYPFEARSDSEAIRFAAVWDEDAPMELWCEDSKLKRWDQPEQR